MLKMKLYHSMHFFLHILPTTFGLVQLKDFFPFGTSAGDFTLHRNDDEGSSLINIAFPFPFFDQEHHSLYVSNNGAISFLNVVRQYTPDAFPLALGNNRRLIAPFWADVDTRSGGFVYYRETQDRDVLTRVSNLVSKYFVQQRRFSAKWAMVVTWLNVHHYGTSSPHKENTFQVILATDGISSFSVFLYNKIQWIHGTASSGIPAQVGFNAGDGARYYSVPDSRTPAIFNIISKSNYDVPGMWIFQVDGERVKNEKCSNASGRLVLSPRSGIELGGTMVYISGPCCGPNDIVVCRFNNNVRTNGFAINGEQAVCITPPLYVIGRIPIEVSFDGGESFNFTGVFRSIPLGRNPPDVDGPSVEQWASSSQAEITWDRAAINSSTVDIDILTFESDSNRLSEESLKSLKAIPNTGKHLLIWGEKDSEQKRSSSDEAPIAIVKVSPSSSFLEHSSISVTLKHLTTARKLFSNPVALVSLTVASAAQHLSRSFLCNKWYKNDKELYDVKMLQEELPPCPRSLNAVSEDPVFVRDEGVKHHLGLVFHPGSKRCFRSVNASASGAGQQCCYGKDDNLIVGPPAGGTLDVVSPAKSLVDHFKHDVVPWLYCCRNFKEGDCHKYYKRRPSDDGARYVPPPVAATSGDPHLVTFDGVSYTFNGRGEYVLLRIKESINVEFQGRMEPIVDSNGQKTRATALTALAVRESGSDNVEIELNARRVMDVFINGEQVDFDEQIQLDFTGLLLIKRNRSKLKVVFSSGLSIDVEATEELLNYEVTIPVQYKGKTSGLLGFWDDSKEREFLLPNGSFMDTNTSARALHYEFGQKWLLEKGQTLFTYRLGKRYEDYVDLAFTPVFVDNGLPNFSDSTQEQEARRICGNNSECMFDIAMTGKKSIGETTFNSMKRVKERTENLRTRAGVVHFGCDGVQDSGKIVDACGVCGGDNSSCTDCNGVLHPDFVNNEKCDKDEKKFLKFYLLVIGTPVGILLMTVYYARNRFSSNF